MDGLKIMVPMLTLLVLLAAVATPAMAQGSSDTMGAQSLQGMQMGQAQQGQAQMAPAQQGQAQMAPAQQGQAQMAPAQQAPAQQGQAQMAPAQQGQAQMAPAQQGQAQMAPAQQAPAQQGQAATEDLMTLIENNPDLSAYAMALKDSGHDQKLTGEEPYMVFAPTDQAIKRDLGYTNATTLSSAGKYMLEGTIVPNPQAPSEGSKQTVLTAINGQRIDVVKSDNQVMANSVKLTTAIPATNGILVITDGIV